ncbi:hypothetical protein [Embleya scabrispora]|uniref:hypothetical protein n=1 Tax=Embleya scabrispora TaxID=159449 RepID=UPI00035F1DCC|nr:hypothetical protein [Embleya scabrispora]MYS80769.1 hypothetical protein [Streptomyces sp. SID5474]
MTVSNGGHTAVRCTSLAVELPIGTRPRDLVTTAQGIEATTTTPGWSRPTREVDANRVRFEFVPSTPEDGIITEDPVEFVLTGVPVNNTVGVAYPRIVETSAKGQDAPVARTRFARLPKFPAGTTTTLPVGTNLRVYAGEAPIDGRPPAVSVRPGSKVTVAWNPAHGVVRRLHHRDQQDGEIIPDGVTQMVCGPLLRETTFTVQTVSQVDGTVNRYDSITVQVDVPQYPKVTIANAVLAGPLPNSVIRIESPATVAGTLSVKEAITAASTLAITGTVTAPAITAATTQFAGTLAITGALTANNLTAARVTTTRGLTASGRVDILKAGRQELSAAAGGGSATFTTDGLILANAHQNGNLTLWVRITGGAEFRTGTGAGLGTLIAPVRAGDTATWGVTGTGGTHTFHWYAFGV